MNKHLQLFNAIVDTNGQPDLKSMDKIISIVHRNFPEQSVNQQLLAALIKISANAEEFPFVKSVADEAIALAQSTGLEYNPDPVM